MSHPLASRLIYTTEHLSRYLSALPHNGRPLELDAFRATIETSPINALRKLQLLQMAFCPFGSLAIHYSPTRVIALDPEHLFHKIVIRRQGGYCMENNAFWSTILRSLGFNCYVVGARVSAAEGGVTGLKGDGFGGFGHEAVIVKINGEKWLTDVGFGGRGSCEPILLQKGAQGNGGPGVVQRLDWRCIADATDRDQRYWVVDVPDEREAAEENGNTDPDLQYCRAEKGWRPAYCFADNEWLPHDFESLNYRTCREPKSMFVQNLILTKVLLDENGMRCVGLLNLVKDELSRRLFDADGHKALEKEVLLKCKSEHERVTVLKDWFGIELSGDEIRGIRGLSSEIKL